MNYFDLKKEMMFDSMQAFLASKQMNDLYVNVDASDDVANKLGFSVLNISYFDHFLDESSYIEKKFVSYSIVYQDPNYIDEMEIIFNNFFQIFSFIYDRNNGEVYAECCSPVQIIYDKKTFMRKVLDGLKERPIGVFVFPNIPLILSIGYDLTHKIYVNNDQFKHKLVELIKKNNIFILNYL